MITIYNWSVWLLSVFEFCFCSSLKFFGSFSNWCLFLFSIQKIMDNGLLDDLLAFLPLSNQTESIDFQQQQQKSRNKTTLLSLTTKQKPIAKTTTTTILLMTNWKKWWLLAPYLARKILPKPEWFSMTFFSYLIHSLCLVFALSLSLAIKVELML